MEEAVKKVLDASLSHIKWKLRYSSRRRLETDVLALCTGMRAVIMVDYGGKMPELQDRLCAFLKLAQKESIIFEPLQVMVIEDMIYLVHVRGLAEFVDLSLNSGTELLFVDLEQNPPKMIKHDEKSCLVMHFASVQKLFSLAFPANRTNSDLLQSDNKDVIVDGKSLSRDLIASQSSEFIDLSHCLLETQITVPTLNGWLLGYPVVYLFAKEHIEDAIYNLSTKSLNLFKILVHRNATSKKGSPPEELMSFSVPYELSLDGSNEPWAKAFLAQMQEKWQKCKNVWGSFQLEVSSCYPQAIVL